MARPYPELKMVRKALRLRQFKRKGKPLPMRYIATILSVIRGAKVDIKTVYRWLNYGIKFK